MSKKIEENGIIYEVHNDHVDVSEFTGDMLPNVIIPMKIENKPVAIISSNAFKRCVSLLSITIPNSVTSIGDSAFEYCKSLKSVKIPDSVTSIGSHAFYGCSNLSDITLSNNLTKIADAVFLSTAYYNNESNWENEVLYIGSCLIQASYNIAGDYTIKQDTKVIADYAFEYCSLLTSVTIPNGVTNIGECAFAFCTLLSKIIIPDSIENVGKNIFNYCNSLKSIEENFSTFPPRLEFLNLLDKLNKKYCIK